MFLNSSRVFRRRRRASLMTEYMIYIGLAALAIAGAVALGTVGRANARVNAGIQFLSTIVDATRTQYSSGGTYDVGADIGLYLIQAGQIPRSMHNGTALQTPWRTLAEITGAGTSFTVTFRAMAPEICRALLAADMGRVNQDLVSVAVGTTTLTPPFNNTALGGACGSATADIIWTFQ